MILMSIGEAAERLGVSVRQVQHLVADGQLRGFSRGMVDGSSVERLQAERNGTHTRAWSASTAWGAVALLSGMTAEWMGTTQRSRLRGQLRRTTSTELVARVRNRALVTRWRAHSSAGRYLLGELVYAVGAAGRLGLAESDAIDGYVWTGDVAGIVDAHGLINDDAGRVTLRATDFDLGAVRELANGNVVLAALDLAGSLDTRERRAGLDALDSALEGFRD